MERTRLLVICILLVMVLPCPGAELKTRPFSYHEDFESGADPVRFWVTNGKYLVNFKGITEEKAFSGKKSFKLDVTITEGSYAFWEIPLSVPAEGKLKCSARVLVEEASAVNRFGLGTNCIILPPFPNYTTTSRMFPSYEKTGDWKLLEIDVVQTGRAMLEQFLSTLVWAAAPENVAALMNRVCLYLTSRRRPGEDGRIVVYVDDITVSGEVPDETEFVQEAEKRWAPAKERNINQISAWEKEALKAEKELAGLTDLPPDISRMKEEVAAKLTAVKKEIEACRRDSRVTPNKKEQIETFFQQLPNFLSNIRTLAGK